MKKVLIIKIAVILAMLTAGISLYLTEFQKYRIRSLVEEVRGELVGGRMDYVLARRLEFMVTNATLPSVEKYGRDYLWQYGRSGGPDEFATGIMLDNPPLSHANGIGKSITIPMCIMLLEVATEYPPVTREFMEKIACTLLPKGTGQSFGIDGEEFAVPSEERSAALKQWRDWYEENKCLVFQDDQRRKAAVEAHIGKQKQFAKGIIELNQNSEGAAGDSDGHQNEGRQ